MERKNEGVVNEKFLFHGTMGTKPSQIYISEQGFDFRYCTHGLWGVGTYFAEKASYSHCYVYAFFDVKQLKCSLGRHTDANQTLRKSPNKSQVDLDSGGSLYDSVCGESGGL